jgi:hypothetical protein
LPSAKEALHDLLRQEFSVGAPYFALRTIREALQRRGLSIAGASLRVYLSEAVKSGAVYAAGHGWYSRLRDPVPLDFSPIKPLVRGVQKSFPLLAFSCWSTAQVNPWLHHVLAQPVAFLFAPDDALGSVAEFLETEGWKVAVNPPASATPPAPGERTVVLRPAISKQPSENTPRAPIEKILVDLLVEVPRLRLMDTSEAEAAARDITGRYRVQVSALQSYAKRRGVNASALLPINKVHSEA